MGEAESWDELLETATTALDRLASGRSGEFWLRSGTWHARLRATRKTVNTHIQFGGAAPGIRLNDYQLVLLYGVNYTSSAGAYPMKSIEFEVRDTAGMELDAQILGLPAGSDFNLYACYADKTALRNYLAFELGRSLSRWAPRQNACEAWLHCLDNAQLRSPTRVGAGKPCFTAKPAITSRSCFRHCPSPILLSGACMKLQSAVRDAQWSFVSSSTCTNARPFTL